MLCAMCKVVITLETCIYLFPQDPRQLHLAITRNHGTTGTISVDYSVTYLPQGVTDTSEGDSSVFAMASGSVRLLGGQMVAEWDLEILNEAFLDTSAQFHVEMISTNLVEGGKQQNLLKITCTIMCPLFFCLQWYL